jgi:CMP-2-keto-3-deoxyoctulosonic acid synthetase
VGRARYRPRTYRYPTRTDTHHGLLDADGYAIYALLKDYLMKITKLPESRLEKIEKLEQLRVLENGGKIKIVLTNKASISIDSPEDLKRLKK